MAFAASIVFGSSLLGVILLFALKRYESARHTTLGGPWRAGLDVFALRVKRLVMIFEWYLARTPILFLTLVHLAVHTGALGFARLMRALEARAHELADFVSHKRNFERRETRSEFLKKVGEYKNGNGKEKKDTPSSQ
ncbi:MAG: hypothetical protein AAB605_01855 [Patescibacteria group bacterium]